jgi:hypothetical protein
MILYAVYCYVSVVIKGKRCMDTFEDVGVATASFNFFENQKTYRKLY